MCQKANYIQIMQLLQKRANNYEKVFIHFLFIKYTYPMHTVGHAQTH